MNKKITTGLIIGIILVSSITTIYFYTQEQTKNAEESQLSSLFLLFLFQEQPILIVTVYKADKCYNGTTILPDNHDPNNPRIIEINMTGEIIWEYVLPPDLKDFTNPGFDAERLPNNNILFVCAGKGVYEINRSGVIVWSYNDSKVSHDADRLSNNNTLIIFGNEDQMYDFQVKEVHPNGTIMWNWSAKDHFNYPPWNETYCQGWTHANAVTRLANNNTLISLRNFDLLVIVNKSGDVVKTISNDLLYNNHDPEVLLNGNILVASQRPLISCDPFVPNMTANFTPVLEIDPNTNGTIWFYNESDWRDYQLTRDTNRLPNNNTLITGSSKIIEVTTSGEVVWQLELNIPLSMGETASRGFYKAQRIPW